MGDDAAMLAAIRARAAGAGAAAPAAPAPAVAEEEEDEEAAVAAGAGLTVAEAEAALAAAADAVAALGPCEACGAPFAACWSGAWVCLGCQAPLPAARVASERRALVAARIVDEAAVAAAAAAGDGLDPGAQRGVRVGWLRRVLEAEPELAALTTADFVARFVKPRTAAARCRLVELPELRPHVGRAQVFVSHTWCVRF